MNIMNIIMPYRHPDSPDIWVFDDEARELDREPFIGEANQLLDYADEQLDGKGKLVVFFRADHDLEPIGHHYDHVAIELKLVTIDEGGSTYTGVIEGGPTLQQVWLCPALLKYFATPPPTFHAMVVRRNKRDIKA